VKNPIKKISFILMTLLILTVYSVPARAVIPPLNPNLPKIDMPVIFNDAKLEGAIKNKLNLPLNHVIVMSDMANLTQLSASSVGITDLTGLNFAVNITNLDLTNNKISNAAQLKSLTKLINLYIGGNSITDISFLKDMTNLECLYIGQNGITDFTPINNLKKLYNLNLKSTKINDISFLLGLPNLKVLGLNSCTIGDFTHLSGLTNLTSVDLGKTNFTNLSILSSYTNLQTLDISENSISDFSGISKHKNLTGFYAKNDNITDIGFLWGLTNLLYVDVNGNNISDITPLKSMTKLVTLCVSGSPINNISFFSDFKELKILGLDNTGISDISPLSGLKNLLQVRIASNKITNISPLVSAKNAGAFNGSTQRLVDVSYNYLDISLGSQAYEDIKALENGGINIKYSPQIPQTVPQDPNIPVSNRIYGQTRFETAATISQNGWVTSDSVVLANAYDFPDALAGTPFAYIKDAPILLTDKGAIDTATMNEIIRLKAKYIFILGGTGVISADVENSLKNSSYTVERIYDMDRYKTAVKIGKYINTNTVIITTGDDYPDALAIGPFAAKNSYPILFTTKDTLNSDTKQALISWNIKNAIIVGGPGVVSKAVEDEINSMQIKATRLSDNDRYLTALKIVSNFNDGSFKGILISTGDDFPDALAGGPFAAKKGYPMFLVSKDDVESGVLNYIKGLNLSDKTYALGGPGVVSDKVISIISNK